MGLTDTNSTSTQKIMVFRPKLEEMKDFSKYLEYMESQGAYKAGLAKIIPPAEWKPRKNGYDDIDITIKAPIQQVVQGGQGLFQQYNIQKKSMSIKDFKKMANSPKYQTPSYFDYEDLERKYWKNVTFNPAIYGADVSGSVTDKDCMEFNINNLNTCLDMINDSYGIKIMGVNTAYLYFGMWKSTFPWHTEDMDLYSINYLHFGAPKSWYCIPPEHGKRLERLANGFFPSSYKQCPAFLRHKMTLISPQVLKKYSIPFNKITQEEGEFMITFPYSYHAGYNHGYNCAESTNFALPRWVEFGKRAVRCLCRSDSVQINMEAFVKKYQPERYDLWLQGKDIGPDPKDPAHVCAAPAPSTYERDIMSKFNKPKRHPPHKKDYSSDTEDECCEDDVCAEPWTPPTKAARKMFDDETDIVNPLITAPSILSISADTISSMPKPPTISETIHRLHQNLNSSADKQKGKKRKKLATESSVPPHLLNHSYAKLNHQKARVSSCTQPNSQTNCEYLTNISQEDSHTSDMNQTLDSIKSEELDNTSNTYLYDNHSTDHCLPSTQSTSHSQLSADNDFQFNPVFQNSLNSDLKSDAQNVMNQIVSQPPQIKPYYEYSVDNVNLSSQPPLLTAHELGQHFQISRHTPKQDVNPMDNSLRAMVEASTSTDDLGSQLSPSMHTNSANNNAMDLDDLTKKTLQYYISSGLSPQGFADEIRFNVCMSAISPHCAVCTLLKPYQQTASTRLSQMESFYPPKSSQILIPSVAFTSKVIDESTLLNFRDTSPLIVCSDCRLCVHSVCYGVSNLLFDGSEKDWKCDRCSNGEYMALCYLCPLRGGPLKETLEVNGEKQWAHICCALLIPEAKFVNGINKKPIDLNEVKLSRRTDRMGCIYCRKANPDNKMVDYLSGYVIQCKCSSSFHVTCGHRQGVVYSPGDWPNPITICCQKCSNLSQINKKQINDRLLTDVHIDEEVIAKHKNRRYYNSKVINKKLQVFYHVHFVDNSFTKQLKGTDILNRDCEADPPEIGDPIEVIWNKEQLHGKYTGKHSCLLYFIQFDDGSEIKVKRDEFYTLNESLPKKVQMKLSSSSVGQYVNNEDSNSKD